MALKELFAPLRSSMCTKYCMCSFKMSQITLPWAISDQENGMNPSCQKSYCVICPSVARSLHKKGIMWVLFLVLHFAWARYSCSQLFPLFHGCLILAKKRERSFKRKRLLRQGYKSQFDFSFIYLVNRCIFISATVFYINFVSSFSKCKIQ